MRRKKNRSYANILGNNRFIRDLLLSERHQPLKKKNEKKRREPVISRNGKEKEVPDSTPLSSVATGPSRVHRIGHYSATACCCLPGERRVTTYAVRNHIIHRPHASSMRPASSLIRYPRCPPSFESVFPRHRHDKSYIVQLAYKDINI